MASGDTTNIHVKAEAEAVAALVQKSNQCQVIEIKSPDGGRRCQVLATPVGNGTFNVEEVKSYLDMYLTAPERRKGTAELGDLQSLIDHANRFKDADSALFASPDPLQPKLVSVIDYHRAGADSSPRFGEHRGEYCFPLSDEWKAWTGKAGPSNLLGQAAFAELIENRLIDVLDPVGLGGNALALAMGCKFATPNELLELSRGMSVRVGAAVKQAVNLSSGEVQVQYTTEHQNQDGSPLKVPSAFLVGIPVFRNGARYQIAVRLRYRVREGVISWFYEMFRTDVVFHDAFAEACARAQKETSLPLFVGSPERNDDE